MASVYRHKDQVIMKLWFYQHNTTVWSRDVVLECVQHKEAHQMAKENPKD